MSFVRRWIGGSKIKEARRRLAEEPTPMNYSKLASVHARAGDLEEAIRVCEEGLGVFGNDPEILRLYRRSRELLLEDRTRELWRELEEAPRSAVYRELCANLLEAGRHERAEKLAFEWFTALREGPAQLMRARARLDRYLAGRGREDGHVVLELLDEAEQLMQGDPGPLELRLELFCRIGAWADAHLLVARLLELQPGDPELEDRYRALQPLVEDSPAVERALRDVELSGHLVDEEAEGMGKAAIDSRSIRPRLKELKAMEGVHAAIYTRGATALVQGPKGATAERTARATREVVSRSKSAARRLGLGQAHEIEIEGDFGHLIAAPGSLAAAAVWCSAPLREPQRRRLGALANLEGRAMAEDEE